MMKVKSFILAGLLAFAPAMAMNGQALAQNEAAAPVAATPVDADPKSSDPGAPADSADANVANVSEAAPAAKVAPPPRMKPTEGIGMPRPGEITLQEQFTETGRTARWLHDVMLVPIITIVGMQFSFLIAGTIIIEQVFYLPGLGRLIFQSISARDLIVVESVIMLIVFAVIAINFLVDLAYAWVDPRLRSRT